MKKTKVILIVVLAFVLALTCIVTPSFSWFQLPKAIEGNELSWQGDVYDISVDQDKKVTAVTTEASSATSISNVNLTNFASGNKKSYTTKITNNSAHPQTVSFYCQLVKSGDGFCVGVNSPTKTYKIYNVSSATEVPIVLNMKVEAGSTQTINWYIYNSGSKSIASVNISGFYMTI